MPERPLATSDRLRRVRSILAVVVFVAGILFVDTGVEWIMGRSLRPFGSLLWFVLISLMVLFWADDIGLRKSALLLFFVPFFGFFVMGQAVYRIANLPNRYWGSSVFPERWTIGYKIGVAVGLVLFGLTIWSSTRSEQITLDRTLEDSANRNLARFSFGSISEREHVVLVTYHAGRGFIVKQGGTSPLSRTAQWWVERQHWWGTDWAPAEQQNNSNATVFDRLTCYGGTANPYCLAQLPSDATYFQFEGAGRVYSGSASLGVGLVFVEPAGGITRLEAYNEHGILIYGYAIDLTPRPSAGGVAAKPLTKAPAAGKAGTGHSGGTTSPKPSETP